MHYLGSPYKRAQLLIVAFDLVLTAALHAFSTFVSGSQPSWKWAATAAAVFAVSLYLAGFYSLYDRPRLVNKAIRAVMVTSVVVVPLFFLQTSYQHKFALGLVVEWAGMIAYLVLLRPHLKRRLSARPRQSLLAIIASPAGAARLAEAAPTLGKHAEMVQLSLEEGSAARLAGYDTIVYEPHPDLLASLSERLVHVQATGKLVIDLPTVYGSVQGRLASDLVNDAWLLGNNNASHSSVYLRARRLLDIMAGLFGLAVAALPMAVIALMIRVTSPGPVLFRQERLGRNMQPFVLVKFRTMRLDSEKDGPRWATENDPRVTPVGRFLRRTRLDELPQLYNILVGEMTLIGPRPIRQHFADKLSAIFERYDMRFLRKPGLTGWSQVLGPYGSTVEEHRIKLEMDLFYIQNASPLVDLYILVKTIRAVLGAEGK